MTPTEFVAGLAEVMEVQRTELATVDRALAKKGLRRIARGRARPDINLMEGVQIACGWAGAKNLTDAAEEIERQRNFVVSRDYQADELGIVYDFDIEYRAAFGMSLKELSGKNFLEVVSLAASQSGAGAYPENDLWISVEKGGGVGLGYRHANRKQTLGFFNFNKQKLFGPQKPVSVTVKVRGPVLKWISDVTEGA